MMEWQVTLLTQGVASKLVNLAKVSGTYVMGCAYMDC